MTDIAVKFENLSKCYKLYNSPKDRLKEALHPFGKKLHREFYALKNINLEVKKGEILGIVGRNGSGKSTLLKIVSGVVPPNSGRVIVNGEISTLLELGSGMNPDFNGIQNIYFGGIMMGFSHEEMNRRIDDIIAFADIGNFITQPLKTYSSGMKARLGFALAVNVSPEILVVDEVLSVGDDLFKRKCFAKMEELFKSGCTVFFVSHSIPNVVEICTRTILLDKGELILEGPPAFVTRHYQKLLYAVPANQKEIRDEIVHLNRDQEEKGKYLLREAAEKDRQKKNSAEELLHFNEKKDDESRPTAFFIPDFVPKTTVKHELFEAEIFDSQIQTLSGKKVNALVMHEEYILSYQARFNVTAENVRFVTLIQGEKGLSISGFWFEMETPQKVMANETYLVQNRFTCSLLPGTYYVSIVVTKINENSEKVRLCAINDATVFKVLEEKKKSHWGIVTLGQSGHAQKIN